MRPSGNSFCAAAWPYAPSIPCTATSGVCFICVPWGMLTAGVIALFWPHFDISMMLVNRNSAELFSSSGERSLTERIIAFSRSLWNTTMLCAALYSATLRVSPILCLNSSRSWSSIASIFFLISPKSSSMLSFPQLPVFRRRLPGYLRW